MNGVLTEQLKPLRSKTASEPAIPTKPTNKNVPKERKKHSIKRQAEKLLKSNSSSQKKAMRKDWEICLCL